jgi:hypothetical protein
MQLYARSDDGIVWEKPALHRYQFGNSSANNILFDGTTAIGIYDDSFHDKNATARFKVWGNLPGDKWQGAGPKPLASDAVDLSGLQLAQVLRHPATLCDIPDLPDMRS